MTAGGDDISPELAKATRKRAGRLRDALAKLGTADGLLVTFDIDIRYLTGFIGDDSMLLVGPERVWIITDPRYDESLNPWRDLDGTEVVMGVRHRLPDSVRELCGASGIERLAVQAESLTVAGRNALAATLGLTLVDTEGLVPGLRRRKDALEVAAVERAVAIQQEALTAALAELRIGMTEIQFAARLEYEMKARGASGASFPTITASAANSSIIHHAPGSTPIGPGPLLVDWGAVCDFYCSDMTRTFGVGEMPAKIREIYDIVLEAQQAAIAACAPGRTCAEIDAVARDVITRAGYGEFFGHGLGHGVGLEIHESPYFNELETETRLEPGMIMTVEPGIYLPDVGGVRIEDDVLITERGGRVLNDYPKDLASAILDAQPAGVS
ncbi:MAG: aminopeptidase P family protein [Planctomycetes bacterium]|nr:aminopeptidase P family protein [Planctomycetota bacterium]